MKRHRGKSSGFTVIETIISLTVFMILTLATIHVSTFASSALERIAVRSELMENARIAVDIMSAYIRSAEKINTLNYYTVGGVKHLDKMIITVWIDGKHETREFTFSPRLPPSDVKYHRLEFGDNELASYIRRVNVSEPVNNIRTLTVITDSTIAGSSVSVTPVSLTVKIRVY